MRAIAQNVRHAAGRMGIAIGVPRSSVTEPGFENLRKTEMNAQLNKFLHLHLRLLVGGIAAILVSGIALGSLAIRAQDISPMRTPARPTAATPEPGIAETGAGAHRCAECGVIESTREFEPSDAKTGTGASGRIAVCSRAETGRKATRSHEITVRLRDGSVRVITDAKPARWRHGEQVTIIAGAD
jgi:hypothetical protein